jgi:hypothetical protein
MKPINFRRHPFYPNAKCETCDGEGYLGVSDVATFNASTMEVGHTTEGERCPECDERSRDEYEFAQQSKWDAEHEESKMKA